MSSVRGSPLASTGTNSTLGSPLPSTGTGPRLGTYYSGNGSLYFVITDGSNGFTQVKFDQIDYRFTYSVTGPYTLQINYTGPGFVGNFTYDQNSITSINDPRAGPSRKHNYISSKTSLQTATDNLVGVSPSPVPSPSPSPRLSPSPVPSPSPSPRLSPSPVPSPSPSPRLSPSPVPSPSPSPRLSPSPVPSPSPAPPGMYYDQNYPVAFKIAATGVTQVDVSGSNPRSLGPEMPYTFDSSLGLFRVPMNGILFRVSGDTMTIVDDTGHVVVTLIRDRPRPSPSPSPRLSPSPVPSPSPSPRLSPSPVPSPSPAPPGMYYDQNYPVAFKITATGVTQFDVSGSSPRSLGPEMPYTFDSSLGSFRVPMNGILFRVSGDNMSFVDETGHVAVTFIRDRPRR